MTSEIKHQPLNSDYFPDLKNSTPRVAALYRTEGEADDPAWTLQPGQGQGAFESAVLTRAFESATVLLSLHSLARYDEPYRNEKECTHAAQESVPNAINAPPFSTICNTKTRNCCVQPDQNDFWKKTLKPQPLDSVCYAALENPTPGVAALYRTEGESEDPARRLQPSPGPTFERHVIVGGSDAARRDDKVEPFGEQPHLVSYLRHAVRDHRYLQGRNTE